MTTIERARNNLNVAKKQLAAATIPPVIVILERKVLEAEGQMRQALQGEI